MSPEEFEDLVIAGIQRLGYKVQKIGNTNGRDGGIDFIACPESAAHPYILAGQVKHSHTGKPVGSGDVRDFRGAIAPLPINIAMLITNTRFTADAIWAAKQRPSLIKLRDLEDLRLWLEGQVEVEDLWDEIPDTLELAPGVTVQVPKPLAEKSRKAE